MELETYRDKKIQQLHNFHARGVFLFARSWWTNIPQLFSSLSKLCTIIEATSIINLQTGERGKH